MTKLFILLFIACVTSGCSEEKAQTIEVRKGDSTYSITRISISELADNLEQYNGKMVEVREKFALNFEDVALHETVLFAKESSCLWLTFTDSLAYNKELEALNDKEVIVRGRVNADNRRHMGGYFAAIEFVDFIKRME